MNWTEKRLHDQSSVNRKKRRRKEEIVKLKKETRQESDSAVWKAIAECCDLFIYLSFILPPISFRRPQCWCRFHNFYQHYQENNFHITHHRKNRRCSSSGSFAWTEKKSRFEIIDKSLISNSFLAFRLTLIRKCVEKWAQDMTSRKKNKTPPKEGFIKKVSSLFNLDTVMLWFYFYLFFVLCCEVCSSFCM